MNWSEFGDKVKRRWPVWRRGVLLGALAVIVLYSFPERHVWEWWFRRGPAAWRNKTALTDDRGVPREVWRWATSGRIVVYGEPGVPETSLRETASGVRSMVAEMGLPLHVQRISAPAYLVEALSYATVTRDGEPRIDYDRFAAALARLRDGRHADVVVVKVPFTAARWIHGMASFSAGLAVISEQYADLQTAKHETGHLLGYLLHNSFPLWVLGYPDEPWQRRLLGRRARPGLMVLYGADAKTLTRTRQAIRNFWKGQGWL